MMRTTLSAALLVLCSSAASADDTCAVAANKAMDATVAATITLATATRYMTSHDDWCDGSVMALEQQDGVAVDHAWSEAINAQALCTMEPASQAQMAKLIATLHRRRLKISSQVEALHDKCD